MEMRRRKHAGETASRSDAPSVNNGSVHVHNSSEAAADAVVGAAVRGGSLLMLLALVQRASTFVLNVLLQRAMLSEEASASRSGLDTHDNSSEPASSALEAYGAAAITLELISSTALFLAREPFRVALARSRVPTEASVDAAGGGGSAVEGGCRREAYRRRFVNTAWVSAPVGLAFAAFVRLTYRRVIQNDAFEGVEENRQAVSLVCLAAALELLCEPLALISQYQLLIDVRVTQIPSKCRSRKRPYLLVTRAGMGVLSFGYAQLLHSATLAAGYIVFAAKDVAAKKATIAAQAQQGPAGEPPARPSAPSHPEATTTSDNDRGFAGMRGWLPRRPAGGSDGPDASPGAGTGAGTGEEEGSWVDHGKLRLAGALAGQSLLKHVLTEGDKIVLARATSLGGAGCCGAGGGSAGAGCGGQSGAGSLYEQGVYAIASGYGSLAARLLFQPLEEAARLMFSKLGAEEGKEGPASHRRDGGLPPTAAVTSDGKGASSAGTDRPQQQPPAGSRGRRGLPDGNLEGFGGDGDYDDRAAGGEDRLRLRKRMAALLATLLKLVLTAGLVFVCFGFHYTETLLRLLLASKGGSGGGGRSGTVPEVARVLSWYCVYVLFLAANGMCEAFACAVARGGHLAGMGAGLVASFAAFWALVGPLTARFGTRGLVMANAAGMACRVVCSGVFIRRFFLHGTATTPLRSSVPEASSSSAPPSAEPPPSPDSNNSGRPRKPNGESGDLWRRVVAGALPHPGVVAAMALSSAAAFAASPDASATDGGGVPWDVAGAARHVGVGAVCLVATAAVFARCEAEFVGEVAALWAARRRPRPPSRREAGDGGGVVDGREKTD
eukprot:g13124.t3